MKFAIISFAHMHAYTYAQLLTDLDGAKLAAVWDDDEARGQTAAQKFGATYYSDYEQLLQNDDLAAVIVCTENIHHAKMVEAAAKWGKHVLCEKPLATTLEDAKRMVDACATAGVKLQTAFPIRYSTPVSHVKRQIEAGELGRILTMSGTNRGKNPGGWFVDKSLSGGGAVFDHTVHIIDIMRWYTGSEVAEVYAEIDTRFGANSIDDCGLLTLTFENGVIASHDPSWSRPKTNPTWGDVTLRVIGTEGVASVDAYAQSFWHWDDKNLSVRKVPWGDDADRQMLQGFVDAIRYDREPLATGWDGLKAVDVALGAYQSAQLGKPVRLSN